MPDHKPLRLPSDAEGGQAAPLRGTNKALSATWACLGTASWIVAVENFSFWKTFASAQDGWSAATLASTVGLGIFLALLFAALLRPFVAGRVGAILLCVLLIVSASVSHYLDAWGVLFDKGLVRNMVETDTREVRELLSLPAFVDVFWRGILPAALLWFVGIRRAEWKRSTIHTALLGVVAAGVAGALLATSYGTLASTFRNHRELRFQLVPTNYINAVYGYLKGEDLTSGAILQIAPDARRIPSLSARPLVLVLIVGETARAANFSLGGYARETNAALANRDILYFQNVVSCGTDTATSLPCMFSELGAEDFSVRKARERENALDVLLRTGVSVQWLDNNSGCKGVCARVPTQQMPTSGIDGLCGEDACQDEILVRSLEERLKEVKQDTAIVLHQMGSHGPAYYRRYPGPGKFQPTCDTNRIQSCDRQALVNTYDNTIEYTSQNIARIVEAARARAPAMDIAVLYISDHGESLGERNIYLHGLPSMLAPSEQTHVPMLAWLPAQTQERLKLPISCLASVAGQKYSHDNLFSTLLGFFGVATAAYRSDLDVLAIARASRACGNAPQRLTLK
ncbi:phosphoethanolamine transferase [Variovorax paradoxus]|jgi:lipid A ethanolaminephosphotransferase|uniref:phosphoethanolamine transferase n=1 Tax=Variovorax paradoxus TaxID=34073 RepID=UPI0009BE22BB|nr:phosphoethanolamine--lipid A transferase [Variovorax paradoxus]